MLNIDVDARDRVILLRPDGALTGGDVHRLSQALGQITSDGKKVRGVVIHAPEFPGWASFSAFRAHVKFVRTHHKLIERLAVATDSPFLRSAPRLARLFISPQVGVFGADELETAREWAGAGKSWAR